MKTITLVRPEAGNYASVRFEPGSALRLAFNPALASFERSGNDLVVAFADGGEVVLRGLFTAGALPGSLFMANGTELSMDSFLDIFAPDMDVAAGKEDTPQVFRGSSMAEYADAAELQGMDDFSVTDSSALLALTLGDDDSGLFFPSFDGKSLFDTLLPLSVPHEVNRPMPHPSVPEEPVTPPPSYGFAMVGHTSLAQGRDSFFSEGALPVVAGKTDSDAVMLANAEERPDGCWTVDSADGKGTVVYNPETGYLACYVKPEFVMEWTAAVKEKGWFEVRFTYYTGTHPEARNGTALFVNDAGTEDMQQQIAERMALLGEDRVVSSILPDGDAAEGRAGSWNVEENALSSIGHILEEGFPGLSVSGGIHAVFEEGRLDLGSPGGHGVITVHDGNMFLDGLVVARADIQAGDGGNTIHVAGLEACTVVTHGGNDYVGMGHATGSNLSLGEGNDTLVVHGSLADTFIALGEGNDMIHFAPDGSFLHTGSVIDGGNNEAVDYVSGRVGDILSFHFANLLQSGGTAGVENASGWPAWEGLSFSNFEALRIDLTDGDYLSLQLSEVLSVVKRLPLDDDNDVRAVIITGDSPALPQNGGWDAQGNGTTVEGMGDIIFQHYYNAEENMHLYVQQQISLMA